jgi:RHS repeat-associated protein
MEITQRTYVPTREVLHSASYGGTALTKVTNNRSGSMACELWYLKNPPSGANTMSVTVTGATDAIKLGTESFTNVEQTAPLDVSNSSSGTSGNPSVSLTTTATNDVVVSTLHRFSTTDASTNRTSLYKDKVTSTLAAASYQLATTAGSYSDTYTGSASQDWCMLSAGFKPVTSGGGSGATTTRYVLSDQVQSTNIVLDSNAAIVQTLDYYPYGQLRVNSGTDVSRREWIGQIFDESSQLNYLNARYYQNTRGQFLSQDPMFIGDPNKQNLTTPQSLNSYNYGEGNPITKSDPTGLAVYLEARGLGTVSFGSYSFSAGSHMYLRVVPDNPGQLSGNFQGQKEFTLGAYNPDGAMFWSNQLQKGVGTAENKNAPAFADFTNKAPTQLLLTPPKNMVVPKGMSADSAFINQVTQSYERTGDRQSYNFTAYTGDKNSASANSNNFTYSVLTNSGVNTYTDNKGNTQSVNNMNAPGWTPGWGNALPSSAQQSSAKSVYYTNGGGK